MIALLKLLENMGRTLESRADSNTRDSDELRKVVGVLLEYAAEANDPGPGLIGAIRDIEAISVSLRSNYVISAFRDMQRVVENTYRPEIMAEAFYAARQKMAPTFGVETTAPKYSDLPVSRKHLLMATMAALFGLEYSIPENIDVLINCETK